MKTVVFSVLVLFICLPLIASEVTEEHRRASWQKVRIRSGKSSTFTAKGTVADDEAEKFQRFVSRIKTRRTAGEALPYVMVLSCDMECKKGVRPPVGSAKDAYSEPDRICFRPCFFNATPWIATGVKYSIRFVDAFGEVIHQEELKDIIVLDAWGMKETDSQRLVYENNPSSKDDLYDKMLQGVNTQTLIPYISISRVAWSNRQVTANMPPTSSAKPAVATKETAAEGDDDFSVPEIIEEDDTEKSDSAGAGNKKE
jgi:hypothetical protein